jgi:exosortase A
MTDTTLLDRSAPEARPELVDGPPSPSAPAAPAIDIDLWRRSGLVMGATWLALFALFWPTVNSLMMTWNGSATYNHCWLILPIIGWLVWTRRTDVAQLTPRTYLPGLVVMAAAVGLWLLGDVADANVVRQAGFIGMLQASVLVVLGPQVVRGLLFPLFYLVFLLPVGDELVPSLQNITADFSVWMLHMMQIPTFRDGIFISIPTGDFEVAEACSGVRFLIATIALGALYANIAFKTWQRRTLVMLLFMAVPVFANALRAFGIIMIAHYSNMEYAVGADHLIYGWGFFAVVTLILLLICRPFSDRDPDDPAFDVPTLKAWPRGAAAVPAPTPSRAWLGAAAASVLALAAFGFGWTIDNRQADATIAALAAPDVPGWTRVPKAPGEPWAPTYSGASASLQQDYRSADGRVVTLYVAAYGIQNDSAELISFGNGTYTQSNDFVWSTNLPRPSGEAAGAITPQAFQIQGRGRIRDVWQWYYVNGKLLASPPKAKLEQTLGKLSAGPTVAATVVISGDRPNPLVSTEAELAAFRTALGDIQPQLEAMLAAASRPGA